MSYEKFEEIVDTLVLKSGESMYVRFSNEDGQYTARLSNGIVFRANAVSKSLGVSWGGSIRNHQARIPVPV